MLYWYVLWDVIVNYVQLKAVCPLKMFWTVFSSQVSHSSELCLHFSSFTTYLIHLDAFRCILPVLAYDDLVPFTFAASFTTKKIKGNGALN